jgi:signal transduction histidine kinase
MLLILFVATLYNLQWSQLFSSYQEDTMKTNAYKIMDDMRNNGIASGPLSEEQQQWFIRRANLYGVLVKYMSSNRDEVWLDMISSLEEDTLAEFNDMEYITNGQTAGALKVSYIVANNELNPIVINYREIMTTRFNLSFLIITIFSILISLMLSKMLSKHILRIDGFANQIRLGNRDISIPVRGPEEIRRLAATLNEVSMELKKQEYWRQNLMEDIAHELRTPITSMLSQLEAIQDGIYAADETRLKEIYEELERISRLVNDLENLSEAESARFALHIKRTDMVELTRRVAQNFKAMAQRRGIKLIYEPALVPCYGEVDPDKIVQVIANVLSNAIKYTPNGGKVVLKVDWTSDNTLLICEDNGIGISEEDLPYIFNRLFRADRSRSRFTGGVGLGLSIAKALVEAHDGYIRVTSILGVGSTFTISIPNVYKSMSESTPTF